MSRRGRPVRAVAAAMALMVVVCGHGRAFAGPGEPRPRVEWAVPGAPSLSAAAAVLMDWRTGAVLHDKDAFRRRDPASTTKVLTALIALERGKLSDPVRISRRAAYTPGSSMYIKPGQVYSLHDLLYGLLLRSGNDAATAIAEHIAGSVEEFAKLMNARAKELGAVNSHFTNPHGLTDAQHYSSAYDLALIAREALRNPTFAEVVALRTAPLTYEHLQQDVVLQNTNRLLHMLPGADGVKTGTTSAAGACLISSATRDDHKLIAVVLHAGNRWSDSARLLEWGFTNFRLTYLGREGEVIQHTPVRGGMPGQVPLVLGGDLAVLQTRSDAELPRLQLKVREGLRAPLRKGEALGLAVAIHEEQVAAETGLYAGQDVRRRTLWESLWQGLHALLPGIVPETPNQGR